MCCSAAEARRSQLPIDCPHKHSSSRRQLPAVVEAESAVSACNGDPRAFPLSFVVSLLRNRSSTRTIIICHSYDVLYLCTSQIIYRSTSLSSFFVCAGVGTDFSRIQCSPLLAHRPISSPSPHTPPGLFTKQFINIVAVGGCLPSAVGEVGQGAKGPPSVHRRLFGWRRQQRRGQMGAGLHPGRYGTLRYATLPRSRHPNFSARQHIYLSVCTPSLVELVGKTLRVLLNNLSVFREHECVRLWVSWESCCTEAHRSHRWSTRHLVVCYTTYPRHAMAGLHGCDGSLYSLCCCGHRAFYLHYFYYFPEIGRQISRNAL